MKAYINWLILALPLIFLTSCSGQPSSALEGLVCNTKAAWNGIVPGVTAKSEAENHAGGPSILYQGSVDFTGDYEPENDPLQYFDFDQNSHNAQGGTTNDLYFGITASVTPFLVFSASPDAQIAFLGEGEIDGFLPDKTECDPANNDYMSTSIPIPYNGAKYCLITNEGRQVEWMVTKIEKSETEVSFKITIEYVVWEKE